MSSHAEARTHTRAAQMAKRARAEARVAGLQRLRKQPTVDPPTPTIVPESVKVHLPAIEARILQLRKQETIDNRRMKAEKRKLDAGILQWAQNKGYSAFFKGTESWEHDDGLPGDGPAKLLQHLTDETGVTIATTREESIRRMLEHRRDVFQVQKELPRSCEEELSECLARNSIVNADLVVEQASIDTSSAVAVTAADPLAVWAAIDHRRGLPRRELSARLSVLRAAKRCGGADDVYARHDAVKMRHPEAHRSKSLHAAFTAEEVTTALERVRDVGNGTDKIEPALLMGHSQLQSAHVQLLSMCRCHGRRRLHIR